MHPAHAPRRQVALLLALWQVGSDVGTSSDVTFITFTREELYREKVLRFTSLRVPTGRNRTTVRPEGSDVCPSIQWRIDVTRVTRH